MKIKDMQKGQTGYIKREGNTYPHTKVKNKPFEGGVKVELIDTFTDAYRLRTEDGNVFVARSDDAQWTVESCTVLSLVLICGFLILFLLLYVPTSAYLYYRHAFNEHDAEKRFEELLGQDIEMVQYTREFFYTNDATYQFKAGSESYTGQCRSDISNEMTCWVTDYRIGIE